MKRLICAFMALCMLCGAAMAAELESAFTGVQLLQDERTAIDLNGDGAQEEVLLQIKGVDGEEELALYVFDADGGVSSYTMYVRYMTGAFAADLDGDGAQEILVSADFYSDDYCTYAFHYDADAGVMPLNFANVVRGEATEGYTDYGYGMVTAVEGNRLTLTGSQDTLGTWMASRVFSLQDGQFETVDDGLWQMVDVTENADIWEYYCLILTKELPVVMEDGAEAKLAAGEKFVVTKTDRESIVYFETEDGKRGSFAISPDVEYGWGSLINGESEENWFEYVPYAD